MTQKENDPFESSNEEEVIENDRPSSPSAEVIERHRQ